jgi:hypothetical protein
VMDLDTICKVMLILVVIPIILFLWCGAFAFIDDCFCGGEIQYKAKQWFRRKMGIDND